MSDEVLSRRALGRATLARQLLLARAPVPDVAEAVDRLGGLQAQEPRPPFAALWSRLEGFAAEDLRRALAEGEVVRATLQRATLHLVSATAFRAQRPVVDPALDAALRSVLKARRATLDLDAVLAAARARLDEHPHTFDELRDGLAAEFPDADVRALGYAVRMRLPLVMVPTEDRWAFPRAAAFALAEDGLDASPASGEAAREALVRHHLAAFGPATAADVQAWSGLTGLGPVVKGLREQLVVLRDEAGRELFDLPDAPRPGEDAAAPARLLAPFDAVLLAHADRTRIVPEEHRPAVITKNLRIPATFLWDGLVRGTWTVARKGRRATLTLAPFGRLPRGARAALEAEAEGMARFLEQDAEGVAVAVEPA